MLRTQFFIILFLIGSSFLTEAQESTLDDVSIDSTPYLLLDKGLQFRITENVNALYNFDFEKAERGFRVMQYQYPDHPLPYFLNGLSTWWKIAPDIENKKYDNRFLNQMDIVIDKAKKILDEDPENKEAAFFLPGHMVFREGF